MLLYLVKHPTADFYIMPGMSPPVDATSDMGMKELEALKRYTKVIAEPMKGLKSDKSEVRAETAASLVMKYRAYPDFGGEMAVAEVAIPADENKLILDALAEADWVRAQGPNGLNTYQPTPMQAVLQLYLSEKDGWIPPMMKPGDNYYAIHKAAFVKWRTGPGKDYVIKKVVPTTKPKK